MLERSYIFRIALSILYLEQEDSRNQFPKVESRGWKVGLNTVDTLKLRNIVHEA